MSGIFGTQVWVEKNPFKADGRDLLPALRRYRGEVRASELTTWGTIWRVGAVVLLVALFTAVLFFGTLL